MNKYYNVINEANQVHTNNVCTHRMYRVCAHSQGCWHHNHKFDFSLFTFYPARVPSVIRNWNSTHTLNTFYI